MFHHVNFQAETEHLKRFRQIAESEGTTMPELLRDYIAGRVGMKRDPHLFRRKGGGTKAGGRKAAVSNVQRHGDDFYTKIGEKGGSAPKTRPSGFAAVPRAMRVAAGKKGGSMSKRRPRVEA